jgi:hypothetical protein
MDEGLRLARLVSHDRVGRLSPCVPAKPPLAGEAASSAHQNTPAIQGVLGLTEREKDKVASQGRMGSS